MNATPTPATQHPTWCEPARCTATQTPTLDEHRDVGFGGFGQHVSTATLLDLDAAFISWAYSGPVAAWLTQSIAPWPCSTFLLIAAVNPDTGQPAGRDHLSLRLDGWPTDALPTVLTQLTTLVTNAHHGTPTDRSTREHGTDHDEPVSQGEPRSHHDGDPLDAPNGGRGHTAATGGLFGPALPPQNPSRAPQRVQRLRAAGWRMPAGAVYVGRPTRWGNPFTAGQSSPAWLPTGLAGIPVRDRAHAVDLYRAWAVDRRDLGTWLAGLIGRDLACWCLPGTPCHADVLLDLTHHHPDQHEHDEHDDDAGTRRDLEICAGPEGRLR